MKYLLILLMAVTFWSCEKTHVADTLPYEADESVILDRDATGCVADFGLDVTFYNGYWWFNAYNIDEEVLQMYWMIDGRIVQNVDYPLTSVGYKIPKGTPSTVCVTYIASNGCHRTCVDVDPDKCDYQEYEEYERAQQ